jgi:hypothetical protein
MINTVLCIGASTYSENTPKKINDALTTTKFLERGSVILAFHIYFVLYPSNQGILRDRYTLNHRFEQSDLDDLKACIQIHHFPDCNIVFIDSAKSYLVETGHIYILPDAIFTSDTNSEFPPLEACIEQKDNNLLIRCFDTRISQNPYYSNNLDTDVYRPCIDAVMTQFAATKISNKLGLILAGMKKDGAKGLTAIGRNKGKIAIQNPDEYEEELSRSFGNIIGSRDMPKAAILEADKHGINYDLISLYGKEDFKSLTDWLYESVS